MITPTPVQNGQLAHEVRTNLNTDIQALADSSNDVVPKVEALEQALPTVPSVDGDYYYRVVGGVAQLVEHTYDYVTEVNVVNTTNAYVTLAELITPVRKAGLYEVKFSITFTYDSTNKSAIFQWTLNGNPAEVFKIEPKDVSDKKAMTYEFPYTLAADGAFNIKLEGKCETGTGETLTAQFANIIVEYKK